jgi:hypothetical protein
MKVMIMSVLMFAAMSAYADPPLIQYASTIEAITATMGNMGDWSPKDRPVITFIAGPPFEHSAVCLTGLPLNPV